MGWVHDFQKNAYIFSYIFAGRQREDVCEHLKTRFSKMPPERDVLFNAFGHVPGCVFENVCVIPDICVYVWEGGLGI